MKKEENKYDGSPVSAATISKQAGDDSRRTPLASAAFDGDVNDSEHIGVIGGQRGSSMF